MRDSHSRGSTSRYNRTTSEGRGENVYAWCEESYALAKVGEIGHFVTDVGCADGDDIRNTTGRKIFRILAISPGLNDDGDALRDGLGDL